MTAPPPFIIYALPRSRTFWLSKFLSHAGWDCGHDTAPRLRALEDIRSALDTPFHGTVETAAAPWWRLIHKMRPDIRTVVIRRPVEDCVRSLMAVEGVTFDEAQIRRDLTRADAKLEQIEKRVPGVLSVSFDDLGTELACARVYEHCLGLPHDRERWRAMAWENLTINFPAMVHYFAANTVQIERMKRAATQEILADMARRRPVTSTALTFQQEPFDVFLRDGRHLFAQHHVRVGMPPDEVDRMNTGLMQTLDGLGCLQVTTARSDGRMMGYLMTIITPSLETREKTEAMNLSFFVDPKAPGIGMKLQRASILAAQAQGADVLYLRAGVRGSGPRLGTLYRRLGAEPFGELFSLTLGN